VNIAVHDCPPPTAAAAAAAALAFPRHRNLHQRPNARGRRVCRIPFFVTVALRCVSSVCVCVRVPSVFVVVVVVTLVLSPLPMRAAAAAAAVLCGSVSGARARVCACVCASVRAALLQTAHTNYRSPDERRCTVTTAHVARELPATERPIENRRFSALHKPRYFVFFLSRTSVVVPVRAARVCPDPVAAHEHAHTHTRSPVRASHKSFFSRRLSRFYELD